MTVEEVIKVLNDIPQKDRKLHVMLDCPRCGHSETVELVTQVVLVKGKETNR